MISSDSEIDGDGIASVSMDDIDILEESSVTESSSSKVNSLLSKLRAPIPSDLARKRKVRSSPPSGVERGKGLLQLIQRV